MIKEEIEPNECNCILSVTAMNVQPFHFFSNINRPTIAINLEKILTEAIPDKKTEFAEL